MHSVAFYYRIYLAFVGIVFMALAVEVAGRPKLDVVTTAICSAITLYFFHQVSKEIFR